MKKEIIADLKGIQRKIELRDGSELAATEREILTEIWDAIEDCIIDISQLNDLII